jgi:ABC-type Fe3+ transport system permease subunit
MSPEMLWIIFAIFVVATFFGVRTARRKASERVEVSVASEYSRYKANGDPLTRVIHPIIISILLTTAGVWIVLIAAAQSVCSISKNFGRQCSGPDLDAWVLPFFTAPIGGIAVLCLIIIGLDRVVRFIRRKRTDTWTNER